MTPSQSPHMFVLILLLAAIYGLAVGSMNRIEPSFVTEGNVDNISRIIPAPKLSRSKRVAIFNGQGVVKFVVSIGHPIKQIEKDQSFWFFYNLQSQYIPTTVPIYWWSFWNTTTFVSTARQLRKDLQQTLHRDETRMWFYNSIEAGMEMLEGSERGANCLLRSICEVSQLPFEDTNMFSELLNAVIIPTSDNVPQKYLDARDAGRGGADCHKTYNECSKRVWNWLTKVTKLTV